MTYERSCTDISCAGVRNRCQHIVVLHQRVSATRVHRHWTLPPTHSQLSSRRLSNHSHSRRFSQLFRALTIRCHHLTSTTSPLINCPTCHLLALNCTQRYSACIRPITSVRCTCTCTCSEGSILHVGLLPTRHFPHSLMDFSNLC